MIVAFFRLSIFRLLFRIRQFIFLLTILLEVPLLWTSTEQAGINLTAFVVEEKEIITFETIFKFHLRSSVVRRRSYYV